jgi:hypothetical protein
MYRPYQPRYGGAIVLICLFVAVLVLSGCKGNKAQADSPPPAPGAAAGQVPPPVAPSPAVDGNSNCQKLLGTTGMSREWKSGWIDLTAPMDFRRGDSIRITVAGSAQKFVVRLLAQGVSADSPSGIVGGPVSNPASGVVTLVLSDDYPHTKQISVNGGENPWGLFALGAGNGAVALQSACVFRAAPPSSH